MVDLKVMHALSAKQMKFLKILEAKNLLNVPAVRHL